jgi:thymidylate synthase ThyX
MREGFYWLDHRLTPEVRAMFAAMSSRMPVGGIRARYAQVVEAVRADLEEELRSEGVMTLVGTPSEVAEDRLCEYPLHPKVKEFFNKFVLNYGHSSILELTGSPTCFTEGISWLTAYQLFDSPLCSGQEFSTRAVRRKDWPMARECYYLKSQERGVERIHNPFGPQDPGVLVAEEGFRETWEVWPQLKELHGLWFEIFDAEVNWWKDHFQDPENRANFGIKDEEPFRPALDRARWAIPGTFATGCAHTGTLRERSRIIKEGANRARLLQENGSLNTWQRAHELYQQALPGLKGMGLREAVIDQSDGFGEDARPSQYNWDVKLLGTPGSEVRVKLHAKRDHIPTNVPDREAGARSYLDPYYNHLADVDITFRCSLAVARDWHRHRTAFPWVMSIMWLANKDSFRIHPGYPCMSERGKALLEQAMQKSREHYLWFHNNGMKDLAMLCLPMGTQVELAGQAGLRDAVYLIELRANAHGANFEYEAQAREALRQLIEKIEGYGFFSRLDALTRMGLK